MIIAVIVFHESDTFVVIQDGRDVKAICSLPCTVTGVFFFSVQSLAVLIAGGKAWGI